MSDHKELTKEQIIANQKEELQTLAAENSFLNLQAKAAQKEAERLKEELRIARSDNQELKEAIINRFIHEWRTGRAESQRKEQYI